MHECKACTTVNAQVLISAMSCNLRCMQAFSIMHVLCTCRCFYSQSHIMLSDTTRPPKSTDDRDNFNFVSEDHMRREIMSHKFIEFGKYQQHLYGIKSESVVDIINTGKMCILDVHPQVNH